ncbi:MAG: Uma2 family endonuclease [Candidatus Eremiobacteraeota bacterium]|nr:Uma2 family endonuclease [Candidatus Eremiobacteraeota bacterium]MBV8435727.1 Uma2 family endonuclease [Candidatus Eremiobacteraeota bacterium]
MYAWTSEKPYIEFHAGRKVRKVSPNFAHGVVQTAVAMILHRCGHGLGNALTECHFDMSIQLGSKTILVPDVAFIRRERTFGFSEDYLQIPAFAPDVAVEIRSPADRQGEREWKIATYLLAECPLVLDISPKERTIVAHGSNGRLAFSRNETFVHEAAPWLQFDVNEAFVDLDRLTQ